MRARADAGRLGRFMAELGRAAEAEARVYFTGGATAVLEGWRESTLDADIRIVPDADALLRAIPRLKEELQLNVELASPSDFIPELPGWADRSPFIRRQGRVSFHHYDFYAQALAKIERGHAQDRGDVDEMLRRGRVHPERLRELFAAIEPQLYRYPAIDPARFRAAVEAATRFGTS
ncbi:MAG TPA: DUF6036 family nucleotidyltransferase [Vicinamibacteria bacterium]|nr:DUF6036 family nucleotidyltransferase [Vicinamibacteria bacterium]